MPYDDAKRRRIALWIFGVTLTTGTTLAALGSCDDRETSNLEITNGLIAPPPPLPPPTLAPLDTSPAYFPSPPLDPAPSAKGPRRRPPRPSPRR